MSNLDIIRKECEESLKAYAAWISPDRYYGDVHDDMFDFFQAALESENASDRNALALIPRDHQKSWCAAVTVTWALTKWPWFRVNYVSWSEDLVQAQRNTIQSIFRSERHRLIWPEHLNFVKERGQLKHKPKGRWNQKDIELDHPEREKRMVRDSSVRFVTAKAGSTGMHCDMTIFDDVVTDENWYGEADKKQIMRTYKSFAKIMSAGGKFLAVGTRYSPDDLYHHMQELTYTIHSTGQEKKRWNVFERVVEDSPLRDGTGNYCWPKMEMPNGEVFGFDEEELAIKKADALIDGDIGLFYGQYYNDPNNDATKIISKDCFKYLEPRFLRQEQGHWFYKSNRLKIYAGADLAWTDGNSSNSRRRDYTAVAVVGIDEEGFIYVLDITRFQTEETEVYYEHIIDMHEYWGFNKITIETNSAGKIIKKNIEDEIRRYGGHLTVEGRANVSHQGKKEERIAETLHHRYKNGTIFHNKGKYTRLLEEEIQSERPPHDDLKDVLAMVVADAVAPFRLARERKKTTGNVVQMSRFGGRRRSRRA